MSMRKIYPILGAALLAAALSACGPAESEESASASPTPPVLSAQALVSVQPVPTLTPEVVPTVAASLPAEVSPSAVPEETPAPTSGPLTTPTPTPTAEPMPEPVVSTPTPAPPPSRPADEMVMAAYHEAEEAYSWFSMTTLPLDTAQPEPVGELIYYPVSDPRFPTMDALRAYLKTLFSDEIVDALLPLDGVHYLDLNGALYAMDGARGGDLTKGGVTYSVVWPEGEPVQCTVRAEAELLDETDLTTVVGKQVYEFPYQKVGEKWVFTQFESIF